MICIYLKPAAIANLRLVSRLAGPIGLQYLVPEVHLLLARASFEQLKAIAEHPVVSKYVTSLLFEADKLVVLPHDEWASTVVSPGWVTQFNEIRMRGHPCQHASPRSVRTFNRAVSKLKTAPRHVYTEEQMAHAFRTHVEFTRFQQDSQAVLVQEKELAKALKQFPQLKELTLSTQRCCRPDSSRLKETFEPSFCTFCETDREQYFESREPLGVQQMRSLLLGAYHAKLKVEILECGVVSWRILQQDTKTFDYMRNSVSNLKHLRLEFGPAKGGYDSSLWLNEELEMCREYLERGRLRDFVTAAPKLEYLQIGFQFDEDRWPAHFRTTVGAHRWASLKTAKFKMIGTSEDDLVSFCSRHAETLNVLCLCSVGLVDGDWFSAFTRMRKVLTLDTMAASGTLTAPFPAEDLDLEAESEFYCPGLKESIETYFKGPCSSEKATFDDFLDQIQGPDEDEVW